ncbi:hypothetical protein H0H93_010272 [Arthromyces matolae]|nr:hypothetical protein H0H93_010272 [Arthromyces matolae]
MGARGVLAATMMDAYGVAQTMLGDWLNGGVAPARSTESDVGVNVQNGEEETEQEIMATEINSDLDLDAPPSEIQDALRKGTVLEYGDWKKIDEEEQRRGEVVGKERERMEWEEVRTFLGN